MGMNTEAPTTAAELLSEWKTLNALNENATTRSLFMAPHLVSHMAAIAARLDEMCEDAGIVLIDGVFQYSLRMLMQMRYIRENNEAWLSVARKQAKPISPSPMQARDQQALQEWLLIKNENGK